MLKENRHNAVHITQTRRAKTRQIIRLLRTAGDRELDIVLAFIRSLVRK